MAACALLMRQMTRGRGGFNSCCHLAGGGEHQQSVRTCGMTVLYFCWHRYCLAVIIGGTAKFQKFLKIETHRL